MLGAIIGDIVGSRFEFNPTNDYNFELFSDECSFTDDTICTIAVADALLKGKDYGESIHEWCRKYPNPMGGYGGNFRKWVLSNNPQPYNSFGNGSAMRVSPIGWWCTAQEVITESKKTAACTHNHEDGICGALAVAIAIYDCYEQRRTALKNGLPITGKMIDWGLDHARQLYFGLDDINLDIESYRNKFDETCQGTVPVALWIVKHSKNFEDAVRKAVSLGADADTLGAITGSIAEALWGIPEWMKEKALSYLPQEMKEVIGEYHCRLTRLRHLTKHCKYYQIGEFSYSNEKHLNIYNIEKEWAQGLSKSYNYADEVKMEMAKCMPLNQWQDTADEYDLPLSLLGNIYLSTKCKGKFSKNKFKSLEKFLDENYEHVQGDKKDQLEHKKQAKTIMLWKLGAGNMGKFFNGDTAIPAKETKPSQELIQKLKNEQDPNAEYSEVPLDIPVSKDDMEILRMGHLPDAMEDHWLMYTDDEYIRYFRSWTGQMAFEAHYHATEDVYRIDNLRMNIGLVQFGVNGDEAGAWLFRYLLTAEIGENPTVAWEYYLDAWEKLHKKHQEEYKKRTENFMGHIPSASDITENDEFVFFWGHHAKNGQVTRACLSQWWPCHFEVVPETYNCAEQFMMAEKARIMGDEVTRREILKTSDPKEIKALGRMVRNFDEKKWDEHKYNVVALGNLHKFQQNPQLKDFLLSTGSKVLVEASPYDVIWGIGYAEDAPECKNPEKWRGQNLLGIALMQVRNYIKGLK